MYKAVSHPIGQLKSGRSQARAMSCHENYAESFDWFRKWESTICYLQWKSVDALSATTHTRVHLQQKRETGIC